jgi:hypothetical protein
MLYLNTGATIVASNDRLDSEAIGIIRPAKA